MSPVEALTRLGGIGCAADITRVSSRQRLRTAVANGDVVRLGRSRYALPTPPQGMEAAVACGGYVSHLSAGRYWGWEVWVQPAQPAVIAPTGADLSRVSRWVTIRREDLPSREVDGWATSPLRTVLDRARDLPFVQALAVADSALRHGGVTHEELVAAAAAEPEHVRRVAAWADVRPANVFESALRALAVEAGARVVPQYAPSVARSCSIPIWQIRSPASWLRRSRGVSTRTKRRTTATAPVPTR